MFLDTSASNRVQLNTTVAQNAVSVNGLYPLLIKNTADNQTNEVNAVNYTTDVLVRVSDNGSHLCIGEPTMGLHATNKSYVDGVVTNYLPRAGGNMTGAGPIQYPTDSGNGKLTYYISGGGGYSPASGKYVVIRLILKLVQVKT